MNLRPLILTLPLFLAGCKALTTDGYLTNWVFLDDRTNSNRAPFLFCANEYFKSPQFINYYNRTHTTSERDVVAITNIRSINGPHFDHILEYPMKCWATRIYGDHQQETAVMEVTVEKYSDRASTTLDAFFINPEDQLLIDWKNYEWLPRRIEVLKTAIANGNNQPVTYKCYHGNHDSTGKYFETVTYTSSASDCGLNTTAITQESDSLSTLKSELDELEKINKYR
ncbi:hypothetical protein O3S68_09255 [Kosakonia sp. SOY2]|uniref:hypothetical protein n=1 Tax=Kosakonia sp. SOY2 TaxID=3014557 RepID=UPI0022AC8A15|nr:hypothetical protein [Kosakonia sp. SOY2]MCZ3382478.1 hypothetical protein [Kosakonia sp. SOY2]